MFALRMPWLAVALAAGILATDNSQRWWVLLFVAVVALGVLLWRRRLRGVEAGLLLVVLLLGGARYTAGRQISPIDISYWAGAVQSFRGVVATESDAAMGRQQFVAAVDSAYSGGVWRRCAGNVMVTVYTGEDSPVRIPEFGDRVEVQARVYMPQPAGNPGQASWSEYLARRGIYSSASIRDPDKLDVIGHGRLNPLSRFGQKLRDTIAGRIMSALPSPDGSVVTGMALGTYAYLTPEVYDQFTNSGTLHLLAASGFNCFIMAVLGTWLIKPFRIRPQRRALFVIPLLLVYMLMVGPKPSILRATVMAVLVLLAIPLRRQPNYTNLVFVAAFAILLWRPYDLYDAGFQLSFLAVLALALVVPVIDSLIAFRISQSKRSGLLRRAARGIARVAIDAAAATVAVTLVTWPILALDFNYFSMVTVPANIVLGALAPVVLVCGMALGLLGWVPVLGAVLGYLSESSAKLTLSAVSYFGSLPYGVVSVASPPVGVILIYYGALALILVVLRRKYAAK